jgi:phosphohistidine phosphatase SixA
LDETGRRAAEAMGRAIRALGLPIGEVWSSPTYRALQTVRLAGLPTPTTAPELGDRGQSMQAAGTDQTTWLKAKVAMPPKAGTDTVIVTHLPNITAAYGPAAAGVADGEALVFHPDGHAAPQPVARIEVKEWPELAGRANR